MFGFSFLIGRQARDQGSHWTETTYPRHFQAVTRPSARPQCPSWSGVSRAADGGRKPPPTLASAGSCGNAGSARESWNRSVAPATGSRPRGNLGDSLRGYIEADIPVLPKRVQHRHGDSGPRLAVFTEEAAKRRLAGSKATGRHCHDVYGGRRDPSFIEVGCALLLPCGVIKRIWGSRHGSAAQRNQVGPGPGACAWPPSDRPG